MEIGLIIDSKMCDDYRKWLYKNDYSESSIKAYISCLRAYMRFSDKIDKDIYISFKNSLEKRGLKPSTINQRIIGMNKFFCDFLNLCDMKLSGIKIQQTAFVENVITLSEYQYFLKCLKEEGRMKVYYMVRTLALTGMRVSELRKIKVYMLKDGYGDIYAKGRKYRRIFFPSSLIKELLIYSKDMDEESYLFLNTKGHQLTTRGIEQLIHYHAERHFRPYLLKKIHPHSFRHLFAIQFLKKRPGSINLLADLLGHSSINTTRLYLKLSSDAIQKTISSVCNW